MENLFHKCAIIARLSGSYAPRGRGSAVPVRKLNLGFCNVCNELKVHNNGSSDAVKTAAELLLKLA